MQIQQKTTNIDSNIKWFVLRGFNIYDKDETGFLGLNKDRDKKCKNVYKIVESHNDALKFPSENIYKTTHFGTPKQWLDFFKNENELSNWNFHLMKIATPKVNNSSDV